MQGGDLAKKILTEHKLQRLRALSHILLCVIEE